jgi:hypothetical protein
MSDDPLSDCPECGGAVHRVIQPVGVIFRGSGFYITDNRQSSSPTLTPPKEADKGEEGKALPTGETEAESKPAKKTESKSEATD